MDYLEYVLANDLACMIHDETKIIKEAKGRGIAPLYAVYKDGADYSNYILTDKVVGTAAANLCILLNIKEVETNLLSKKAYNILKDNHIKVSYKILTDNILNNKKDDLCPLEKRFLNNGNHFTPLEIIEEFLKSINML